MKDILEWSIIIIAVVVMLILIAGVAGLMWWGIGAFVIWAFGISFIWTFWHGLATAILLWAVGGAIRITVKKEN